MPPDGLRRENSETNLHLSAIWEVSSRNVVLQLDFGENNRQLVDQTLLFIVLSEDRGHLLLQIADDVGMDLGGQRFLTRNDSKGNQFT